MPISLKAARINADFTQKAAAERLNISKNTLASYESYRTIPDIATAKKIANLYRLSVNDIIFFAE